MGNKKLNGKNGTKKSVESSSEGPSKWRAHLASYRNLQRLVFESDQELEKAVDLLWTDALFDLPHDSPDGESLVIPAEAVEYFSKAGLKFTAKKLMSISDFGPDEIAALRR